MKKLVPLISAVMLLTASHASAHKRWLLPSDFSLSDKEVVSVDFTASNNIFYVDAPMPLQGLSVVTPKGANQAIENPQQGRRRSSFEVSINEQGTYRIYSAGKPLHFVSYQRPSDPETFRGRGPLAKLKAELPADAINVKFMAVHSLIETFVSLGSNGKPSVPPAIQSALRLDFIDHPTELYSDEPARFRVLKDGKPAKGISVSVIPEGTRYRDQQLEQLYKSNANGEISIHWPQAGRYLLSATMMQAPGKGEPSSRRDDYFVTLEVLAP